MSNKAEPAFSATHLNSQKGGFRFGFNPVLPVLLLRHRIVSSITYKGPLHPAYHFYILKAEESCG